MIYLDYSATTPVIFDVLETYNKVSKEFIGNANSIHELGKKSHDLLNTATKEIASSLGVLPEEIIYTSGATMSNNMALIGYALANKNKGNHIILSKLEHPSMYEIAKHLETKGFVVDYVNNKEDGIIDFDDLKDLIKKETILVSVCGVNSETGIRQPLKMIKQVIHKENSETILHSDLTQALGKTNINFSDVELASMSMHKIYGPKGIGILVKKKNIKLEPLLYGSGKSNELNPGTPPLPLIVSAAKSIKLALKDMEKKEHFIERLNKLIIEKISNLEGILINKTSLSIPHILNITIGNIKPETFIHAMAKKDIYISTNTACSTSNISPSVYALYKDEKRSLHTIRISLSSLTTTEEIKIFIDYFILIYTKLKDFN